MASLTKNTQDKVALMRVVLGNFMRPCGTVPTGSGSLALLHLAKHDSSRNHDDDFCSGSRRADDGDLTADTTNSFPHSWKAEMSILASIGDDGIHTNSIIAYTEFQIIRVL